jgi:PTS system mannose-specific IIA component
MPVVGLVIATHCSLAKELLHTAEMIIGPLRQVKTVGIHRHDSPEEIRRRFDQAIMAAGQDGAGVLVMTDMFGGTPSNIGYSFLEPEQVEVLTGVNLPMLLKAVQERECRSMAELAVLLKSYGQESILLASEILAK